MILNQKNAGRFGHAGQALNAIGSRWAVVAHKVPGGINAAAILVEGGDAPAATPSDARKIRAVAFQRPASARAGIDVAVLRKACGRVCWHPNTSPRPRRLLDAAVFDLVLVARCLATVAQASGDVFLEVVPMLLPAPSPSPGHALRIVGNGWRVIVASRIETEAPALNLRTKRTRRAA